MERVISPSLSQTGAKRPSRFLLLWFLFRAMHVTPSGEASSNPEDEQATKLEDEDHLTKLEDEDHLAKVKLPRKLPSIIEIKKLLITPAYWFVQGTMFVALFVIGHDTGHSAFSKYEIVNTIFGNICHTFLFCPYYMWKASHRKHHMHTCNMDRDGVFYPVRKKDRIDGLPLIKGFALGFGWFAYLIQGYKPRGIQHFNPLDPMFRHHVGNCTISLVCLFLWCMCLARFSEAFGLGAVVYHWVVPTFVFASYMVIITFLHHTEENTPWYSDDAWDILRGQLSTIDRHYGWCHDIIHSISTHQIHHLFTKIPHYHLEEATVAFRKAFPELVRVCEEPIIPAFLRMFKKYAAQNVVENDAQVHIYK